MEEIKILKNKGCTKWKIAKFCNVSWQTVNMWDKGAFLPNKENNIKLYELLKTYQ